MGLNDADISGIRKFYLVAAAVCTVNAIPAVGSLINGSSANFLTIAVFVISVMILLKPTTGELTRIPCVLGILAALLDAIVFMIGRAEQYALLAFISDYTFPIDFTQQQLFTERQLDAMGLVLTIGALSFISWMFVAVAAVSYSINYTRTKKMAAVN